MRSTQPKLFIIPLWVLVFLSLTSYGQSQSQKTYINPLNIDYTYAIYDSHRDLSYRSGADPAVVEFKGEYYMSVTRSIGGRFEACSCQSLNLFWKPYQQKTSPDYSLDWF